VVGPFVGEDGVGLQGGVDVGGHDVFVDEGDVGVVLGGAEVGRARVGYLGEGVSAVVRGWGGGRWVEVVVRLEVGMVVRMKGMECAVEVRAR